MLLLPRLLGGYSGVVVEKFGYHNFFLITALLGIPTLVMIILQWNREIRTAKAEAPIEVSEIEKP
ncbi:AmpG family muropeptide MFS transporter, partial [Pseudomonas syringae pv. actinidiae]|nr:AmpG family muropeptide MFS transporter [Pseudomonas syringae pv. actinidiae]